ncbi:MAG: phosphoribosylformylglycinamidine synthase subunit PurS [bacterium]
MRLRVLVHLKSGVLDPEGETIKRALHQMGYLSVEQVRTGKLLEIHLKEESEEQARKTVEEFSRRLLANPVIETFEIHLLDEKSKD